MFMLDPLSFVLLAFAAFRLTRLVVDDLLLERQREALLRWTYSKDAGRIRGRIGDLISCRWCAGWWVSAACVAAFGNHTGTWQAEHAVELVLEVAAVAGAAGLLGRLDSE